MPFDCFKLDCEGEGQQIAAVWIAKEQPGNCRRELLNRTLIWNQRYLMTVLRE